MPSHGSKQHEDLVNAVRFGAANVLMEKGIIQFAIADDGLMALAVGTSRNDGRCATVYPDLVLYLSEGGLPVIIECGNTPPAKWGDATPVVLVTFDNTVSLINATGRQGEEKIVETIRLSLQQRRTS